MAPTSFTIKPGTLTLAELRTLHESGRPVALDPACWPAVAASAETVSAVIREHRTVYGINTGFGSLAHTRIADDQVTELQRRLVLSHAAGVGPLLDDRTVRLMMILKVNSLALGYSGIRRPVLEAHGDADQCRRLPLRAVQGLGRRLRRSGAPGPYDRRADGHRPDARRRPRHAGGGRSEGGRAGADRSRGQGRAGVAQRHPDSLPRSASWACSRRRMCSRPPWRRAPCRWMPPPAATRRSIPASTRSAASSARSRWRRRCWS